ncbi:phosphoadenylyl-sulfate reductase / adenylyl-sulfate reductase [hydrocarbon metagenome]|uniref:Adenosine 5'-phosphosulfate reductase n=1 Tax=hydrocarbon metagenome TaxID=938273 RepID=A0A0W8FQ12_9ZZZZ
MQPNDIKEMISRFRDKEPDEILCHFLSVYADHSAKGKDRIALASSLGAEDQVLTHMVLSIRPDARVFILDTGRFHEKTYELINATRKHYGINFEMVFPERADVEELERVYGPNDIYESADKRKHCCHIRKVKPLMKVLSTLDVWITGLRRDQAVTRKKINNVEWDELNRLVKLNPLADWDEDQVWQYIRKHSIPYNPLHDMGYRSIGCAPCTRPVKQGEDIRAGRWWWETPGQKECGLHINDHIISTGTP